MVKAYEFDGFLMKMVGRLGPIEVYMVNLSLPTTAIY
jgi:hypothetical protein